MSSSTEEANINPDGTTTFSHEAGDTGFKDAGTSDSGAEEGADTGTETGPEDEHTTEAIVKGVDPALYLALTFIIAGFLYYIWYSRNKRRQQDQESFFLEMDGDKFNIKLPSAVDEYYEVKEKCIKSGWEPGKKHGSAAEAATGPHRVLAQALMKRCIADIPLVTHVQKESPGMNKLYAQSMCSVKQWKSYQAAEGLISGEVEEVRAEADDIDPGWSQTIWRQAMQYHNMLKNKHEREAKQREDAVTQKKVQVQQEEKKKTKGDLEKEARQKEVAAEKAAEELIKMEEREKASKKAFSNGGMKKGFLSTKKK